MRVQSIFIAAISQNVNRFVDLIIISCCILIRCFYYDNISLNGTLTHTKVGVGRVALQLLGPRGVTISSV